MKVQINKHFRDHFEKVRVEKYLEEKFARRNICASACSIVEKVRDEKNLKLESLFRKYLCEWKVCVAKKYLREKYSSAEESLSVGKFERGKSL